MEKCIGCELCAGVCPVNCIYVRGLDNPGPPGQPGRALRLHLRDQLLTLHSLRPLRRGLPTQAITESKMFEFSFTNRSDAIYTKAELLVDDQGYPQRLPWEDWREGEAAMTGVGCARPHRTVTPPTRVSSSGRPISARAYAPPRRTVRGA